jgi:hypothetical protein
MVIPICQKLRWDPVGNVGYMATKRIRERNHSRILALFGNAKLTAKSSLFGSH